MYGATRNMTNKTPTTRSKTSF